MGCCTAYCDCVCTKLPRDFTVAILGIQTCIQGNEARRGGIKSAGITVINIIFTSEAVRGDPSVRACCIDGQVKCLQIGPRRADCDLRNEFLISICQSKT